MSYEDIMSEILLKDERFIILTAENRALIRNIQNHPELKKRFIDTGITEQTMIGIAAGLALRGRVPIVHALAAFLTMRAFEFIRTDVGIAQLPVKFTGFIPGLLSDGNGPTHQAIEDIAIMRGIPGMQVFAPGDENDMIAMLPVIWQSPFPSYVRANTLKSVVSQHASFQIGKAEVFSEGADVTFLVYGMLFSQVWAAKEKLITQGVSVGLVNVRSIKPLDEELILSVIYRSELLVIVEDHFQIGGLHSIVAELLLRERMSANVISMSLGETWFKPGRLEEVLHKAGLSGQQIADRTMQLLQKNVNKTIYVED